MPVFTRSKRKLIAEDEIAPKTRPCFVRLENFNLKENNRKKNLQKSISTEKLERKSSQTDVTKGNAKNEDQDRILLTQSSDNCLMTTTTQRQQNPEEVITVLRKIRKVLDRDFKNVKERLQLDVVPRCLYDLKTCVNLHNSNVSQQKASKDSIFLAQTYLTEERHFQFFHFIRHNLCGLNKFPGHEICIKILQEIFKYKSSKTSQFTTKYITSELYCIFSTILNVFPPCQNRNRKEYLKVFTTNITLDALSEKKQILSTVLSLIQDLIHHTKDNISSHHDVSITTEGDFNKNFYIWDVKCSQTSSFLNLSRNDRFERLFIMLDLLIRVLEFDLAIFLIKNSHKFGVMSDENHKPMICSIIWQNYDSVIVVNNQIKQITSIFVAMVALNYPSDKVKIVSRLISLIANVINLYEYHGDKIEYPAYRNYSLDLAREIQKNIESSVYYSIDLYLNVIENLRSSLLRMLLAHQLYLKINNVNKSISLDVPINSINNQDFQNFTNFESGKKKIINVEKYPVYEARKNPLQCKVTQSNYLKLMMFYAEAVSSYYKIKDCAREIKKSDTVETTQSQLVTDDKKAESFDLNRFKKELSNIDLNEKVQLRKEDLNYTNLIHVQLTKHNCIFYRNEIKNISILNKLVNRSQEKFGSIFNYCAEFMNNNLQV